MQRLIIYAQRLATNCGETQLTPAHLLLGITHDRNCSASVTLAYLGVDLDELQIAVQTRIPPSLLDDNPELHMSTSGTQIINDAFYVARTMGDGVMITLHLLMAIYTHTGARADERVMIQPGVSAPTPSEILASMGITRERLWKVASDLHRGFGPLHGVYVE